MSKIAPTKPKIEIIRVSADNFIPNEVRRMLPGFKRLAADITKKYGKDSQAGLRARYALGWFIGLSETIDKKI